MRESYYHSLDSIWSCVGLLDDRRSVATTAAFTRYDGRGPLRLDRTTNAAIISLLSASLPPVPPSPSNMDEAAVKNMALTLKNGNVRLIHV